MDDLEKRSNDAGIRLVMIEMEAAAVMLSRLESMRDPKQRMQSLKEARATLALASRLASHVQFPDKRDVSNRLQQLWERVDHFGGSAPKGAARATERRLDAMR